MEPELTSSENLVYSCNAVFCIVCARNDSIGKTNVTLTLGRTIGMSALVVSSAVFHPRLSAIYDLCTACVAGPFANEPICGFRLFSQGIVSARFLQAQEPTI